LQKALKRRNVLAAIAAAKELPQLSLLDALELTVLIARKDPRRFQRAATRWLLRYLVEHPDATIEGAGLVASSLLALPGASYQRAAGKLRAMAERATSRRRTTRTSPAPQVRSSSGASCSRSVRRPCDRPRTR
jgi:hypothetical protein